jgi:MFS family permease
VNRNVKTVLAVSILFGIATGTYEFVLPYYLKEQGLSFQSMGTVFAVAAAGMLLVRVLMGRLADVWGRKLFYGLSLGGSALAMWLTPTSGSVPGQSLLKTLREAMFLTRDTLHPVVLYEEHRDRFMDFMGKTRGMEFLFQAAGTLISGVTIAWLGTGGNLRLAGWLLAAASVVFWVFFRERPRDGEARVQTGGLRDLFSLKMHRNLRVIMVSVFIFNIGISTSHNFIMPLFFSEKFHVSTYAVSWVMVIHRATIALPLLLAGAFAFRNLKGVYIWALVLEGVIISASAFIPNFHGAAAVWLLHDLLGAGIWIPIQNLIIQDHTRPEQRALEMGKILAYGGIGTIIGPWLAGLLSEQVNVSAPFFASGVLMIVAAAALAPLRLARRS